MPVKPPPRMTTSAAVSAASGGHGSPGYRASASSIHHPRVVRGGTSIDVESITCSLVSCRFRSSDTAGNPLHERMGEPVGVQLAKYPTNHGVEKEPTETEEPSHRGDWSGEVDALGLPQGDPDHQAQDCNQRFQPDPIRGIAETAIRPLCTPENLGRDDPRYRLNSGDALPPLLCLPRRGSRAKVSSLWTHRTGWTATRPAG